MRMSCSYSKVALVLTAFLLGACDQPSEAARLSQACGNDASAAYDMTKRFVTGNLGKIKSADFPSLADVRVRKAEPDNPCAWLIYGYVDLKTRAGAAEQRPYVVTITYSGDNRWRATDFQWQSLGDNQKAEKAK